MHQNSSPSGQRRASPSPIRISPTSCPWILIVVRRRLLLVLSKPKRSIVQSFPLRRSSSRALAPRARETSAVPPQMAACGSGVSTSLSLMFSPWSPSYRRRQDTSCRPCCSGCQTSQAARHARPWGSRAERERRGSVNSHEVKSWRLLKYPPLYSHCRGGPVRAGWL